MNQLKTTPSTEFSANAIQFLSYKSPKYLFEKKIKHDVVYYVLNKVVLLTQEMNELGQTQRGGSGCEVTLLFSKLKT